MTSINTVGPRKRTLLEMAHALREFEGWRSMWRVPIAIAIYALIRGVPIAAAVIIALATVQGRVGEAIVSATIALVFDALARKLRTHLRWNALVSDRLWTFERPNPATGVHVLVRADDAAEAQIALRNAKFNPEVHGLRINAAPPDALDLNFKLWVQEPQAWPQSSSDQDRARRIVNVLEAAAIRARVNGTDVPASDNVDLRLAMPGKP